MTRARGWLPLLGSAGFLAVTPAAASAPQPQTLDPMAGVGYVSSEAGYTAWSHRTGPGRYQLMIRKAGRTRTAAVRSRRVPFDVSLGRDARRRVVAVFSRCSGERDGPAALPGELPAYPSFKRCRLRLLDLRAGKERGLELRDGSNITSRYMPSIAGRRVAYAGLQRTAMGTRQSVFVQRIGSRDTPRRLPGGTTATGTPENGPLAIDIDARRVVYAWQLIESPCAGPDDLLGESTELWSDSLRSEGHRLLRRAGCPGDPVVSLLGSVINDSEIVFIEEVASGLRLVRQNLSSGSARFASMPARTTSVAVESRGSFLAIVRRNGRGARLQRLRHTFGP